MSAFMIPPVYGSRRRIGPGVLDRPDIERYSRRRWALGDLGQELVVALGAPDLVHEQLEPGGSAPVGGQRVEHSAQLPDLLELPPVEEELLVTGGTGVDVDRRVQTSLGQTAIEAQLHVARALELLEDHLVHL